MQCKWRLFSIVLILLIVIWGVSYFVISYKEEEKFNLTDTVKITVYYEALCPDSKYFVTHHLQPLYDEIPELLTLDLVPYGKAETVEADKKITFKCQHGETECYANKIHSCVIDFVKEPSVQLKIVSCMIKNNDDPDYIAKVCTSEHNVDVTKIFDCAKGERGALLLKHYGERTKSLNPGVKFIPTIELNNRQDIVPQSSILKNLQKAICGLFETKPKICK